MESKGARTFDLPNGETVIYTPAEIAGGDAYVLEIRRGSTLLGRYCSCNGVSRPCPEGKSPSCDCTKKPPVLTCV
jgi:hypothetical protein